MAPLSLSYNAIASESISNGGWQEQKNLIYLCVSVLAPDVIRPNKGFHEALAHYAPKHGELLRINAIQGT